MSRTFDNYLKARERNEALAKEKVDRLNHIALQKVKYNKMAEKEAKNQKDLRKDLIEKRNEKMTAAKQRKDGMNKDIASDSMEY